MTDVNGFLKSPSQVAPVGRSLAVKPFSFDRNKVACGFVSFQASAVSEHYM